ncbi:hypothetical protein DDE18_15725 [Nocardioides gansuensis]|uniref:MinD-like ATPase involved in chromosome partitioning or flagellar assembly n=1 Tax=Nocardioides gansuensis TaxID=2138300 RepID=A0A2T8F8V3_9ACTN|nr:hypothetical protein [Nocardioides gansuensis]PVG82125.1 hypothetical protein DDE18_15725 [Nocardioides gansuensis]
MSTPTAPALATTTDARRVRAYSTLELRAAASALAAGKFACRPPTSAPGDAEPTPTATSATAAGAPDAKSCATQASSEAQVTGSPTKVPGLGPIARVWAANAGAGASTITLALADAADAAGNRTRILDAAAPTWSGLLGASAIELGAGDGWRRGRRGRAVLLDRLEDPVQAPGLIPAPRELADIDLTVLDTGWTARELDTATTGGTRSWVTTIPAALEVLVTRANTLALSQTETVLAGLDHAQVALVVVGASRWAGPEFTAAGRRLRQLHEDNAVVFVPWLSARTWPGLGPDPLPKQLMHAGRQLLDRISLTGPLGADPA